MTQKTENKVFIYLHIKTMSFEPTTSSLFVLPLTFRVTFVAPCDRSAPSVAAPNILSGHGRTLQRDCCCSEADNHERVIQSPTSVLCCQGFDQLRIEGLLCDVTLVAGDGDEAFPVHRAMMASSSDYFKAMFTGESLNSLSLFFFFFLYNSYQ